MPSSPSDTFDRMDDFCESLVGHVVQNEWGVLGRVLRASPNGYMVEIAGTQPQPKRSTKTKPKESKKPREKKAEHPEPKEQGWCYAKGLQALAEDEFTEWKKRTGRHS